MSYLYKLIIAITVASAIGPLAFVLWLCLELAKEPSLFEMESRTFEEMMEA